MRAKSERHYLRLNGSVIESVRGGEKRGCVYWVGEGRGAQRGCVGVREGGSVCFGREAGVYLLYSLTVFIYVLIFSKITLPYFSSPIHNSRLTSVTLVLFKTVIAID